MLFCEFLKICKRIFSFDRTPPDDCLLRLSVNVEALFRTLLLQSTSRKLLFCVQVAEFQPPDTVKNYFTCAFQSFYTRSRSGHSKAFIYLKSLKTVCEEVNLFLKLQDDNLQLYEKMLFHASSFTDFVFMFSKYMTITSSEKTLKSENTVSFWKCKRKLVLLTRSITTHPSQLSSC